MAVPYTFATAVGQLPLSQLDSNFATGITLGNTSIQLGNTVTTLNNMTFSNVTITNSSLNGLTFSNATLTNATISSGNITANVSTSTLDGTNTVGFLTIPQNSQSASYGLVLSDTGKNIFHAVGSAAATYTIPANSNIAFATGAAVTFINMSANAVTIAITTDTLYNSSNGTTGSRTLAQYGVATAIKITSTSWIISGSGLT